MKTKHVFCIDLLLAVMVLTCVFSTVFAEVTMGVKKGNMMQYEVVNTGDVPKDHNVVNATIEVLNVWNKNIDIKFTSVFVNGSEKTDYSTLDLETGNLGEAFIIPANLTEGESFFEQTTGNITISKIEERAYAGAKRTTVTAASPKSVLYWDQETGFLVEAKSTYENFTITTTAKETNIWQPKPYELDPTVSIVLVVAIIAALLVIVIVRVLKK